MISVIEWQQNQQGTGNRGVCFDISAFVYNLSRFLPNSLNHVAESRSHRVGAEGNELSRMRKEGPTDRPTDTGRQKPAGQEEEEAAAARFLGSLQLAQLPDLPTLRVCTYPPPPTLLPDSFVCVCVCIYVLYFDRFFRYYVRRLSQTSRNETHIYTRV